LQAIKRKARKHEVMRHTAGVPSAYTQDQRDGYTHWFAMSCIMGEWAW
jgi:hypothetical protein